MGGESNTGHLINALRSLIVDIFWNTISVKEFSKEDILLHVDLDILNSFFAIPVKAKNDIVRLSISIPKTMEISQRSHRAPPARNVLLSPFLLEGYCRARSYNVNYLIFFYLIFRRCAELVLLPLIIRC